MTTFKDLQHGTVNPFQPNTKAISYAIDKTLEQGVHKIDLITNGTYTLGLWLDDTYVGMFCDNSLTFELANDVYVEDVIIKEYNESGSITSAFIGIRHTAPVGTYDAQSITTSELLSPITQVVAYWDDESAFIAGNDDGSSIEVHNPWATQGSTDHVQGVLDNYEYIPVTARGVYADPALQIGDTIVSGGQQQVAANVDWVFDGGAIANIETPLTTEYNFDDPYSKLVQQQFAKKVTLGDSYQGVSIGRKDGLQMLLSPDGTLENAIGRYYADLTKGMAFQTRQTPSDDWLDWMYFDMNEKVFKLELYSTTDEVEGMIDGIALNKVWFAYSTNANGNPMTETPQPNSLYLGTASAVERPTSYTNYEWSLIRGADGDSGVGIDTVTVTYQNNTSGTTPPTGTWTDDPNPIAGQYLWTRTITTYTDSSEETTTYNVTYQPTDGNGIVSTLVEYAISTTPTLPITDDWQTTIPPITHGEYLWTRTTINYTSGDPSVSISSSYFGEDGKDGSRLFMAYADDINGGGFSPTDSEKDYFGLYIGQPPQSTTPSDYDWQPSGFKNEKSIARVENETTAKITANTKSITTEVSERKTADGEILKETRGAITVLSDEIDLKVDADGVIAAINLSADKIEGARIDITGTASFNDNVVINPNGTIKAISGEFENANITGNLNAGKISNMDFDGTGITFPNGNLKLDSSKNAITAGALMLKYKDDGQGDGFEFSREDGSLPVNIYGSGLIEAFSIGGLENPNNQRQELHIETTTLYVGANEFGAVNILYGPLRNEIRSQDNQIYGDLTTNTIRPRENSQVNYNIGGSNARYYSIYLANQPNVSSDARHKFAIQDIPEELLEEISKVEPKMYLQHKTWHFGYIAQDVERVLYKWATNKYGLEAKHYVDKFAMLHKDESYLSLLYGEIAVIKDRQNGKKIKELEERLEVLESGNRHQ